MAAETTCYDRASWTIIFSFTYSPPPLYCATDTFPPLLAALQTVRLLPYLLHALPSPLPYDLHTHQYPLMGTLCALFVHASPHCYLMYHRTSCAHFLTL